MTAPQPSRDDAPEAVGLREQIAELLVNQTRAGTFGYTHAESLPSARQVADAILALSPPPVHAGEADEAHKHTWELEPRSGITLCSEPTCRVPKMRKHEAEEPWLASDHDDYCESRRGFDCNCITYIVNSASRTFARDLAALLKDRRK